MAEFKLQAGATLDLLTKGEVREALHDSALAQEIARREGIKWMRLPETLSGKAVAGVLTLGETAGEIVGPRSGYSWSLVRLVVDGLTTGATPDVVNLYRGTPAGRPLWQFNGNNFGYTFPKLGLVIAGGETLALASVGTFTTTGQVTLSGELLEVPTELLGKLA